MAQINFEEKCVLKVTVDGNAANIKFVVKLDQSLDVNKLSRGDKITIDSNDYMVKDIYLQGASPIHISIHLERI